MIVSISHTLSDNIIAEHLFYKIRFELQTFDFYFKGLRFHLKLQTDMNPATRPDHQKW